jgi:hypothetical protein
MIFFAVIFFGVLAYSLVQWVKETWKSRRT